MASQRESPVLAKKLNRAPLAGRLLRRGCLRRGIDRARPTTLRNRGAAWLLLYMPSRVPVF